MSRPCSSEKCTVACPTCGGLVIEAFSAPTLLFGLLRRSTYHSRTRRAPFSQPLVAGRPVDVREEGLDVFRAVRRRVIEDEGVLPHVHDQNWTEARYIARLVRSEEHTSELQSL